METPTDYISATAFPDFKQNRNYDALRGAKKHLGKISKRHRETFNTLVMHTTTVRGLGAIYDEAINELEPALREVLQEVESLTGVKFEPYPEQ